MQNRVVVITGASAGIGAELAKVLKTRGARLVLAARNEGRLRDIAGADGLAVVADVTKRADHARIVEQALARFGTIDVWVNNAGRGISKLVSELTDEDFDDMMLVNTKSALYGMQAVLPHFKEKKHGHIINVSSMLGRIPLAPQRSAYSASKAALNLLTGSLRAELAQAFPEIRVSTVTPGVVATDFGVNARHGGVDSRQFPGAQPVGEVAEAIADVIEKPSDEAYTRPGYRKAVIDYFTNDSVIR
jgi:NAD(P)-dependent dehydrogenase (short-subunit alcohol dehydrogenase family)